MLRPRPDRTARCAELDRLSGERRCRRDRDARDDGVLRGLNGRTGVEHARAAGAGGAVALQLIAGVRSPADRHRRAVAVVASGGGERARRGRQQAAQVGWRERRLDRQHQRRRAGDQRRREARPDRIVQAVAVDRAASHRRRRAGVERGDDRVQAGLAVADVDAVAGRRAERDLGPDVGVPDLGAGMAQRRRPRSRPGSWPGARPRARRCCRRKRRSLCRRRSPRRSPPGSRCRRPPRCRGSG